MKKIEFILELGNKLSSLPKDIVNEHLTFYSEMIEDRIEEGVLEEDAVEAVGSVDEIALRILADSTIVESEVKKTSPKRKLKGWEITLLAIGSPIWFALLVAVASVIFSLYACLWAVVISIWSTFIACSGGVILGLAAGVAHIVNGMSISGYILIGCAFVSAGIAVFAFYGSLILTKCTTKLTKSSIIWIRNLFSKKEEV